MVRRKDRSTPAASPRAGPSGDSAEVQLLAGDDPIANVTPELTFYEELHEKIDNLTQQMGALIASMGVLRGENNSLRSRLVAIEDRPPAQSQPAPGSSHENLVLEGPQSALPSIVEPQPTIESCPASSLGTDRARSSMVQYFVRKESIPTFKAETPASQPLRRNQEVEKWLRAIEMLVQPASDEQFIHTAKTHCSGSADLLINSSLFDGITSWGIFKSKIREKFRGTCTSQEFYRFISDLRLRTDQAPLDFFLEIQGFVYQGVRDYPHMLGDPEDTVRRVFLEGLPPGLRDFVRVREDDTLQAVVDTAQRVWDAKRREGRGTFVDQRAPAGQVQQFPEARHRQVGAAMWCRFHESKGHNTSECMVGQVICRWCRGVGHYARTCTFQGSQEEEAPPPPGTAERGAPEQWPLPQRSASRE